MKNALCIDIRENPSKVDFSVNCLKGTLRVMCLFRKNRIKKTNPKSSQWDLVSMLNFGLAFGEIIILCESHHKKCKLNKTMIQRF